MFTKSSLHLRDDHRNIVHEHVDGYGKQDHAEELAEDENQGRPEQILDFVEIANDHIVQGDVQEKANEDVHDGVVGAKDAVLMPNTFNSASPAKKKAKKSANAVKQASAARMGWLFSLRLRKIGMEPKISMMAAITKKELNISTKLRVPIT